MLRIAPPAPELAQRFRGDRRAAQPREPSGTAPSAVLLRAAHERSWDTHSASARVMRASTVFCEMFSCSAICG